MNRAQRSAAELRRRLGLRGRVDAEAVANLMGLRVKLWPLEEQKEMQMDNVVGVAERLEPEWRRWVIGHAVGHKLLHPGNHVWIRSHTGLAFKYEREAEDCACALLMDAGEAMEAGLTHSWEIAEHFGVPDEKVRLQAALWLE